MAEVVVPALSLPSSSRAEASRGAPSCADAVADEDGDLLAWFGLASAWPGLPRLAVFILHSR